jgi:ATP-dependent DNA helicase RecG
MNAIELLDIISTGETSKVQFKEHLPDPEKNYKRDGGNVKFSWRHDIIRCKRRKVGTVTGLTPEQIEYADRKIGEFAEINQTSNLPDYRGCKN